ncbi:DNA/RNA nuclease SfsA [Candidatus Latescibacterota bacterium]
MNFTKQLIPGILIRRYKRFLADIELEDKTVVTAHCANTGSMMQVSEPGSPVMISEAENPDRKTRYDWQLTQVNGRWAGINTSVPNILLREGFETGIIPLFRDYDTIKMEVKYGTNSRADAVLSGKQGKMYVEAKNVTLVENGRALFPDAVTSRGSKHLDELSEMVQQGHRAAMFFCVQRMDAKSAGVASHIDPVYADKIVSAMKNGVDIIAWRVKITPENIVLETELPFIMDSER